MAAAEPSVIGTASVIRRLTSAPIQVALTVALGDGADDRHLAQTQVAEVDRDLRDGQDRRPLAEAACTESVYQHEGDGNSQGQIADPPDDLDHDVHGGAARAALERRALITRGGGLRARQRLGLRRRRRTVGARARRRRCRRRTVRANRRRGCRSLIARRVRPGRPERDECRGGEARARSAVALSEL